jgi:hypothetical protein
VVVLPNPGMMHPGKRRRITITAAYCFMIGYLPRQNKMTSVFAINEAYILRADRILQYPCPEDRGRNGIVR